MTAKVAQKTDAKKKAPSKAKVAKQPPPTPAKELFGAAKTPAPMAARAIGFYAKGCLAGGAALPIDGPAWQAMRLSRNRNWGHPELVALVEKLAIEAKAHDGWPGLLVGDISQPRGGPMLTGHASHQVGLDADIWLTPMPDRRLTEKEREDLSATSMLAADRVSVNPEGVDRRPRAPAEARCLLQAGGARAGASRHQEGDLHECSRQGEGPRLAAARSGRSGATTTTSISASPVRRAARTARPSRRSAPRMGAAPELDRWLALIKNPPKPGPGPPAPEKAPITLAQLPADCGSVLASGQPPATAARQAGGACRQEGHGHEVAAMLLPQCPDGIARQTWGMPAGNRRGAMTILITGATGLIGRALTQSLVDSGLRPRVVTRRPHRALEVFDSRVTAFEWHPRTEPFPAPALDGVERVIHLMGEPLYGPLTRDKRARIVASRRIGTKRLLEALGRTRVHLIVASSAAVYGYGEGPPVTETTAVQRPKDKLALALLGCEEAADHLRENGSIVTLVRLGAVIAPGAFPEPLHDLFARRMAWRGAHPEAAIPAIDHVDAVALLAWLAQSRPLPGAIHAVAPEPLRSAELEQLLAQAMPRSWRTGLPRCASSPAARRARGFRTQPPAYRSAARARCGLRVLAPDPLESVRAVLAQPPPSRRRSGAPAGRRAAAKLVAPSRMRIPNAQHIRSGARAPPLYRGSLGLALGRVQGACQPDRNALVGQASTFTPTPTGQLSPVPPRPQ